MIKKEGGMQMKKNKENNTNYDQGQIFVKIMAGVLAVLMVAGTGITLVYALMA